VKPKERMAYILEKVREDGYASVEELSKLFGVSRQIIRKDINQLSKTGPVNRVYGGIEAKNTKENISYDSRKVIHYNEKRRIAKLVSKFIPNNSSLFFSIGTTPEIVALELLKHKNLKIFTNNLNVALSCCTNETFEINILGGKVRNRHKDVFSKDSEKFFDSFSVDFGIFGVGAIENDGTLLDFSLDELSIRKSIQNSSRRVCLVADSSKYDRKAFVKGGNITEVDAFFTDKTPPKNIVSLLEESGTEIFFPRQTKDE